MQNQTYTLDYIKRQAKNLKKERGITHTQALELTAKANGFSNWMHCQKVLSQQTIREVKTEIVKELLQLSFTDWLKKHKNRNSPLGDLASDMLGDKTWPSYDTLEEYRGYLNLGRNASLAAIEALDNAWKSYKGYLRRKNSHNPSKPKPTTPKPKNHDPRVITFVSNVTPIHYSKRTIEKFNVGDKAWISWDGRKAIPVTVLEVDDRTYNFRIERPLKKAGDQYHLFLDEVRSTPELACLNRRTS
ncbi:MAG: YozE family protein [Sediminibacterium sp.]|nr:YozE family protein [Sediminibacterium sp.]MDP3668042.1 YozE family protein [Sediminibacterium sp.]